MVSKPSSFFSGLFVGALASSAAALLFVFQPGGETHIRADKGTKAFSAKGNKALNRYMAELGSWSGEGTKIQAPSPEAFAEAPMGWY